jgi:hypothetical protein
MHFTLSGLLCSSYGSATEPRKWDYLFIFQTVSVDNAVNMNFAPLFRTILIVGRYEHKLSSYNPQYEINRNHFVVLRL